MFDDPGVDADPRVDPGDRPGPEADELSFGRVIGAGGSRSGSGFGDGGVDAGWLETGWATGVVADWSADPGAGAGAGAGADAGVVETPGAGADDAATDEATAVGGTDRAAVLADLRRRLAEASGQPATLGAPIPPGLSSRPPPGSPRVGESAPSSTVQSPVPSRTSGQVAAPTPAGPMLPGAPSARPHPAAPTRKAARSPDPRLATDPAVVSPSLFPARTATRRKARRPTPEVSPALDLFPRETEQPDPAEPASRSVQPSALTTPAPNSGGSTARSIARAGSTDPCLAGSRPAGPDPADPDRPGGRGLRDIGGPGPLGEGKGDADPARPSVVPVPEPLAAVLPRGGLPRGGVVSLAGQGATSLLFSLLAGSRAQWAALVGMPGIGLAAAAEFGIDLDRLVVIPDPGEDVLQVLSVLVDGVEVVAVAAPKAPPASGRLRVLNGRLRQRGAVLLVTGPWPGADITLTATLQGWTGLHQGHGRLRDREILVQARGRGAAAQSREAVVLLRSDRRSVRVVPAVPAAVPATGTAVTGTDGERESSALSAG